MSQRPAAGTDPILFGAGAAAGCDDLGGAEAADKLLDRLPGTICVASDLVVQAMGKLLVLAPGYKQGGATQSSQPSAPEITHT